MIGPVVKSDAAAGRVLTRLFRSLPPQVQLALLALALLLGVAACGAAWIDQQDYVPSPNICRADEVTRTDCQHVVRVRPRPDSPPGVFDR